MAGTQYPGRLGGGLPIYGMVAVGAVLKSTSACEVQDYVWSSRKGAELTEHQQHNRDSDDDGWVWFMCPILYRISVSGSCRIMRNCGWPLEDLGCH